MGDIGPITPPFPTDTSGDATEQPIANTYSPESDLDNRLAWAQNHAADIGALLSALDDQSKLLPKQAAWAANTIGWLIHGILQWVIEYDATYFSALASVIQQVMPDAETAQGVIFSNLFPALDQLMAEAGNEGVSYGGGTLSEIAQILDQAIVQPFALLNNASDPSQLGSGIANQHKLLSLSLGLAVSEWFLDSLAQYTGGGIIKTFFPLFNLISQAVNPYNAVRMAMEYGYRFFVQQPLVRDMNHAYPIKDLGVSALAKMQIRGIIDEQTYLDRCLDSGLDNTQAQQLILEVQKLVDASDVAMLLNLGVMSDSDATQALQQQGYTPPWAAAKLYIDTHKRFFTIQERVGYKAVTAWTRGIIDQNTLESLLHQLGFNSDEISLLEIEAEFEKGKLNRLLNPKKLTYGELKRAYDLNIIGIEEVISWIEAEGYSPADQQTLILMDFTEAVDRQARTALLLARLRVTQQAELASAQTELAKNETALAQSRQALAAEIDAAAKALGAVSVLPGALNIP